MPLPPASVDISADRPILIDRGMAKHHLLIPAATLVFGAIANRTGLRSRTYFLLVMPHIGRSL
ncbi:MAG: hypothetical protein WCA35_20295 [Kovacikia sp.]